MEALAKGFADDSGATMVEYAIMVAFIAGACIAIVAGFGGSVKGLFTTANSQL